MARDRFSYGKLAIWVVAAILVLGFLVQQSLGVGKWRSSFNDEMAQRLDLEEKVARMEKERSALMAQAKDLTDKLQKSEAQIEDLKSALVREREEKKSLQARIELMPAPVPTPVATTQ